MRDKTRGLNHACPAAAAAAAAAAHGHYRRPLPQDRYHRKLQQHQRNYCPQHSAAAASERVARHLNKALHQAAVPSASQASFPSTPSSSVCHESVTINYCRNPSARACQLHDHPSSDRAGVFDQTTRRMRALESKLQVQETRPDDCNLLAACGAPMQAKTGLLRMTRPNGSSAGISRRKMTGVDSSTTSKNRNDIKSS